MQTNVKWSIKGFLFQKAGYFGYAYRSVPILYLLYGMYILDMKQNG